jgi:hypothetical protein
MYPVGKRVVCPTSRVALPIALRGALLTDFQCIARGVIPLEQIPTINVTSTEVILQLVDSSDNKGENAAGISCRNEGPGMNVCPLTTMAKPPPRAFLSKLSATYG